MFVQSSPALKRVVKFANASNWCRKTKHIMACAMTIAELLTSNAYGTNQTPIKTITQLQYKPNNRIKQKYTRTSHSAKSKGRACAL